MEGPLVRVLAARLVFVVGKQEQLANDGVGVQEDRPGGEDHIDRVHVLRSPHRTQSLVPPELEGSALLRC